MFCLENSKKDDERAGKKGMLPWDAFLSFLPFYLVEYIIRQVRECETFSVNNVLEGLLW